jgi:Outer membrane protein beta-barrel domain
MKKLLFSIVLLSLSTFTFAQKFGIKIGANSASQTASGGGLTISTDSKIGLQIGLLVDFGISSNLVLQSGLLYSGKGGTLNISSVTNKTNLNYLEIPLNFQYQFPLGTDGNTFFLNAGPNLAYATSGSEESNGKSTDYKFGSATTDDSKAFDLGLNLGAGVNLGKVMIQLNYGLGLSDLSNTSGVSLKNNNLSLGLGYFF